MIRIALIGDCNPAVTAHRAIPLALALAAADLGVRVEPDWIGTEQLNSTAKLVNYRGIWCVPASPYRSMEGALRGIRYAREQRVPFLGTCGGFQHAVIEYARNVLGWQDAEHAETSPEAARAVIAPLSCALVEQSAAIRLLAGTRIANAYGRTDIVEGYHCSYGINPQFQAALINGPLRVSGYDVAGDIRSIELADHPFFVATLFQHERQALQGVLPPLAHAFIAAC